MTIDRSPGEGRYARVEREQRWLVRRLPDGAHAPTTIVDRYLTGTSLRLRRMTAGDLVVHKLTQKVRARPDRPDVVKLTTMYLSGPEADRLAAIDAAVLHKTRWQVFDGGRSMAVDEFAGRHAGLLLAEVELGDDEPRLGPLPFAVADVTDDDRYSGGTLAHASDEEIRALLRERST